MAGAGKRVPAFRAELPAPLDGIVAIQVDTPHGRLRYILGAEMAALRRVLIVEGGCEALDALGLDWLGRAPDRHEHDRHERALRLAKEQPEAVARLWLDGDTWPPADQTLDALEPRSEVPASSVSKSLARGAVGVYAVQRAPGAVAAIIARGLVPRRWLFLEQEVVAGTSPLVDLTTGGAAYGFARLLLDERVGVPIEEGYDYAIVFDLAAMDTLERFTLGRDRYGSEHALVDALADDELVARVHGGSLGFLHEILFIGGLSGRLVRRIICRDDAARDRLVDAGVGAPLDVGSTFLPSIVGATRRGAGG